MAKGAAVERYVLPRMRHRIPFVLGAVFALCSGPAWAATKTPLAYSAYDGWNGYAGTALSSDGAWFAYGVAPQDGDGVLVVRSLTSGATYRAPRGRDPKFTDDGRVVFFTVAPYVSDVDVAQRAHKKPEQQPKNGFGVMALPQGTVTIVDRVKRYGFAKHGTRFVAYLLESPPKPTHAESSATPSPQPLPTPPENKKKEEATTLVVRDVRDGTTSEIADVTEFAFSDDERYLAYATQTAEGSGDGVHVRDLASGAVRDVALGSGRYTHVVFAPAGDMLAFESDRASFSSDAPHFDVYVAQGDDAQATVAVAMTTAGVPRGWSPDPDAPLQFSKDGARLFLGMNAAPTRCRTTRRNRCTSIFGRGAIRDFKANKPSTPIATANRRISACITSQRSATSSWRRHRLRGS